MSSQPIEHLHPVLDFAVRLVSRLDSLADAPLMSMRPEDKRAALTTLAQGRAQLDALALRLLADAETSPRPRPTPVPAPRRTGWRSRPGKYAARLAPTSVLRSRSRSMRSWPRRWRRAGSTSPRAERSWPSLERLPHTGQFAVSGEQRGRRRHTWSSWLPTYEARALRVLGRRVLEVIAPDLAEEFEGRALEREEAGRAAPR